MLILTRKTGQSLVLSEDIIVTVLDVDGDRVKLGIDAPRTVRIVRQELRDAIQAENLAARQSAGTALLSALLSPQLPVQPPSP